MSIADLKCDESGTIVAASCDLCPYEYYFYYFNLDNKLANKKSKDMFEGGESVEFPGIAIAHLACDKDIMKKSGKIIWTSNLAREYGFTDVDGSMPDDWRSVNYLLKTSGRTTLANFIPTSIRVPMSMIHYGSYKF